MAGRPSGTAATARLIAVINISNARIPLSTPIRKMSAQSPIATIPSVFPNCPNLRCNGVSSCSMPPIISAILPTSELIPVLVTTATARPVSTVVEEYTMFTLSPRAVSGDRLSSARFSAGVDSPVRRDSSVRTSIASMSRASAGTLSPASNSIISPGTSSEASMRCSIPSRITRALDMLSFCRAWMDFSAFSS